MDIPGNRGMTLVEIMAAIAISGILITGVYTTAIHSLRIYHRQQRAAALQQNLRAAVFYLEREIRMAGLDPPTTPLSQTFLPSATITNRTAPCPSALSSMPAIQRNRSALPPSLIRILLGECVPIPCS